MKMINEWKLFFNKFYAPSYEQEVFTQNTEIEVEFLIQEFSLPKGSKIIDVGCGTGRHTAALALAGYDMTGIDLSPDMLNIAKMNAAEKGVEVKFIEADAQHFKARGFDAAICLCEGALSLLGSADDPFEHDMNILQNIYNALKPGAKYVTSVLNVFNCVRNLSDSEIDSGMFDPATSVKVSRMNVQTEDGAREIEFLERFYSPAEFIRMLKTTGFDSIEVYSGNPRDWGKHAVRPDDMEFLAICRKPD